MKNWYCYVCGKKLSKNYYLCSIQNSTDRVFLVCENKCIEQVEWEDMAIVKIVEKGNRK